MRCKCCDKIVKGFPKIRLETTTIEDDVCKKCRDISFSEYSYIEDHTYQFEDIEDGVAEPKDVEY